MSLKKHLVVHESVIHGKGLFAQRLIPAGAMLGRCKVEKSQGDTLYTLWLGEQEGSVDVVCKFKYINHSKVPNVVYFDNLTVVALKAIQPGEEMLHDYGDDWA
jgi:SET domain-containing protein